MPQWRDNFPNLITRSSLHLPSTFVGYFKLRTGLWVIGLTDVIFGLLMAVSYFRDIEIPLTLAGCFRVGCGLWCFIGLLTDYKTLFNIYLLMLLFNNCLVLAVCIAFVIILTSEATIVCTLPRKPLELGAHVPPCPFLHRKGFWEATITIMEFILYLYYLIITIAFLNSKEPYAEVNERLQLFRSDTSVSFDAFAHTPPAPIYLDDIEGESASVVENPSDPIQINAPNMVTYGAPIQSALGS